MPTIFYDDYRNRYFFFTNEGTEPAHVHVEYAQCEAKFWLGPPVVMEYNNGFKDKSLALIKSVITSRSTEIAEVWKEHFGK